MASRLALPERVNRSLLIATMETGPTPPVRDHNQDDATGFMKPASHILLFVLCVLVAGCASTNYSAFEGGRVVEGTGGTKKTVDGIDIWNNGSPPRKFKVIGIIDDSRRQTLIGMAGYEGALVKKAKEVGGDAIIILDAHSEIVGYYNSGGSGTATTTGSAYGVGNTAYYQGNTTYQSYDSTTSAIRNKLTKAAVIKYVD
jgi:hypothetical protein